MKNGDSALGIHDDRCKGAVPGLETFNDEMVWRLPTPDSDYLPFGIADELELRYRYCIDSPAYGRIEEILEGPTNTAWDGTVDNSFKIYDSSTDYGLKHWGRRITNPYDVWADRRHMLTAVNYDRILSPDGEKQININDANSIGVSGLFNKFRDIFKNLEPNSYDVNTLAANLAVNLKDYIDSDSQVSVLNDPCDPNSGIYYGFETPCVYISELAHNFYLDVTEDPPVLRRSYAIELFKPYYEDIDPNANSWRLDINDSNYPVKWDLKFGSRRFHVLRWQDPNALLNYSFTDVDEPNKGYVPGSYLGTVQAEAKTSTEIIFDSSNLIKLQRKVGGSWHTVDSVTVPNASGTWLLHADTGELSIKRDIHRGKCIRGLWQGAGAAAVPNLGDDNGYDNGDSIYIQAHPVNRAFTNVGQIGELLKVSGYNITDSQTEADVRFDIADPNLQGIFRYITLLDPSTDNINNDGDVSTDNSPAAIVDEIAVDQTPEYKIPGRININSAPWFVIAQLPWMTDDIAQAIAAYRDKLESPIDYKGIFGRADATGATGIREDEGFASIGELMNVYTNINGDEIYDIGNHATTLDGDLLDYPDLTPSDGVADDFEERDVIFSRLSNLVTVRSDVFTAYILVRIGIDGPQKRMIAILDRSDVYPDSLNSSKTVGNVKILALHPVAENR